MIEAGRFLAALLVVAAFPCAAAENAYAPLPPLPLGATLMTLPSNHVSAARTWELRFAHRFNGSADEGSFGDRVHSLFGMDSGANVTMGLAYTPVRDLEISLMRSNVLDELELAGKYVVMQQAAALPVTLALRGGADWRTERDVHERTSFFAQAIVSRRFGERLEVFALPTFVTNAGRATSDEKSVALFDHAFNLPLAVAFVAIPNTALVVEWTPANRDLPDAVSGDDAWAVGVKRAIGGHHFEVMLTNNRSTMVSQSMSSTFVGAPLRNGDVHIGFNIERQFGKSR
jgi:hypothetical protein